MEDATTTVEPDLEVSGVRRGGECWLLSRSQPMAPVHVPAAVLVWEGGARVLHGGRLWDARCVFTSAAEARAAALADCSWYAAHYRSMAARYEQVLRQLEAVT